MHCYLYRPFLLLFSFLTIAVSVQAQEKDGNSGGKCATMDRLELKFAQKPFLRQKFQEQRASFSEEVREGKYRKTDMVQESRTGSVYTIPVVFHIVLTNPSFVTDAQIQAQLDTLNRSFSGNNGDSVRIPTYFKDLFGKSSIQFCLAKRTPDGEETTGINRVVTNQSSFSMMNEGIKYSATGGVESWDPDLYLNVWVGPLLGGVVGYATFPNDGLPEEQGIVIDYRSLPGGFYAQYNGGKTLVHEAGHYFNLFHIWGDDNGGCNGSDDVDDTPNQANASSGCYSGIRTDNCSSGNGIMYQNYMDYTNDACLVMFTPAQALRMESAIAAFRPTLINSPACTPPVFLNYNAQLVSVNQPPQRICAPSFTPSVTFRNRGEQVITSLQIHWQIDNGPASIFNWTGNLPKSGIAEVTLPVLTISEGNHVLKAYVSRPSGQDDEERSNDTLTRAFQYYAPVTAVNESFETPVFPSAGWDLVNPDNGITWKRVSGIAKTGNASVMINNFNYVKNDQKDDLRLPTISIGNIDSAFLSFQVAAATYTPISTAGNTWDTLEVLVSTDCGRTYTSLYRKWGSSLVTRTASTTNEFIPTPNEWRKDSINLGAYIGQQNLMLVFRNTTEFENNIYLDDIGLRTVVINPNLKAQGFMVTPNPASDRIAVQFYPPPANLKAIQLFNATGQKISEVIIQNVAGTYYSFDLGKYAPGTYMVRAVFSDRVITRKVVKQ